jgi:hypothetical protein
MQHNPAATAASKALPPRPSTLIAVAVASQWVLAAAPDVPVSGGTVDTIGISPAGLPCF